MIRTMKLASVLMLLWALTARGADPTTATTKSFSVADFGAVANGTTLCTVAFQKALDAAATAGGGTVLVPDGQYLLGSVVMKANTTLKLSDKAVVIGSSSAGDYPIVQVRFEGEMVQGHRGLIYAEKADHIAIEGNGTIQGSMTLGDLRNPRAPVLLEFVNCDDVKLVNFSTTNRRIWSIHPMFCTNVLASHLHIRSTLSQSNGDGIDVDSSQHVRIENCDIDTGDDAISLKSGRNTEAVTIAKPTKDVTITNCTLGSNFAGVSIGTEMSAGVLDVRIDHITFTHGVNSIYIKSRTGRGGLIDNINVDTITSRTSTFLGIDLVNKGIVGKAPLTGMDGIPQASHISITNAKLQCVTFVDSRANMVDARKPVDGLTLGGITGTCQRGLTISHVKNVNLYDIHVTVPGQLLTATDVTGTGLSDPSQPATRPAAAETGRATSGPSGP